MVDKKEIKKKSQEKEKNLEKIKKTSLRLQEIEKNFRNPQREAKDFILRQVDNIGSRGGFVNARVRPRESIDIRSPSSNFTDEQTNISRLHQLQLDFCLPLKRIRLNNVKSLVDSNLNLGSLNLIAGKNSSGKSTIIETLSFLSKAFSETKSFHFTEEGITFGKEFGTKYFHELRSRNAKTGDPLFIEIDAETYFDEDVKGFVKTGKVTIGLYFDDTEFAPDERSRLKYAPLTQLEIRLDNDKREEPDDFFRPVISFINYVNGSKENFVAQKAFDIGACLYNPYSETQNQFDEDMDPDLFESYPKLNKIDQNPSTKKISSYIEFDIQVKEDDGYSKKSTPTRLYGAEFNSRIKKFDTYSDDISGFMRIDFHLLSRWLALDYIHKRISRDIKKSEELDPENQYQYGPIYDHINEVMYDKFLPQLKSNNLIFSENSKKSRYQISREIRNKLENNKELFFDMVEKSQTSLSELGIYKERVRDPRRSFVLRYGFFDYREFSNDNFVTTVEHDFLIPYRRPALHLFNRNLEPLIDWFESGVTPEEIINQRNKTKKALSDLEEEQENYYIKPGASPEYNKSLIDNFKKELAYEEDLINKLLNHINTEIIKLQQKYNDELPNANDWGNEDGVQKARRELSFKEMFDGIDRIFDNNKGEFIIPPLLVDWEGQKDILLEIIEARQEERESGDFQTSTVLWPVNNNRQHIKNRSEYPNYGRAGLPFLRLRGLFDDVNSMITPSLEELLGSAIFVGPLRERAPINDDFFHYSTPFTLGAKGEKAASFLATYGNKKIDFPSPDIINEYIDKYDDKDIEDGAVWSSHFVKEKTYKEHLSDWLRYLDLASDISIGDEYGEQLQILNDLGKKPSEGDSLGLENIGVGVSQVIPVLLAAMIQITEHDHLFHDEKLAPELLLLEQPELHLHPASQAKLADFFLAVAMTNAKQLVIETHSEHLVNRIRHRTAQLKDKPMEDIVNNKVFFASKDMKTGVSSVKEILITDTGSYDLESYPEGFFDQAQKEAYELAKTLSRKRGTSK